MTNSRPKNSLREKYIFKRNYSSNGNLSFKGYCTASGFIVGQCVFYHENGNLFTIGSYDSYIPLQRDRKVGHWKRYDTTGTLIKEIIYINK